MKAADEMLQQVNTLSARRIRVACACVPWLAGAAGVFAAAETPEMARACRDRRRDSGTARAGRARGSRCVRLPAARPMRPTRWDGHTRSDRSNRPVDAFHVRDRPRAPRSCGAWARRRPSCVCLGSARMGGASDRCRPHADAGGHRTGRRPDRRRATAPALDPERCDRRAHLLKALAAGDPVVEGVVVGVPVVRAGDRVRATVRGVGIEAAVVAVAEQNGMPGQIIRVVNPDSRRAVRTRGRQG